MSSRGLDEDLVAELGAIATAEGCELLHLEFKGGNLRLILDREESEGGVTHEHCSRVSRQTSALLDAYDFGRGRYVLEVSSPGLDRPLYRDSDYDRFAGCLARIRFRDPDSGKPKTVVARLLGLNGSQVEVEEATMQDKPKRGEAPQRYAIPLAAIEQARLEVEV
ncbi:MAG: ribosome maturation factor RimP [Acidobacteriota bacterium]